MIADPRIRAVTLTGSDSAGSKVAEQAGRQIKKTVLELGGSDPFIVLEDADVQKAAKTAADARLINSGQSCIAAKRFIVVEKVADAFERRFISEMRSRKMGDPLERDTQVGPQARHDLRAALHRQVEESVKRGAELLLGGQMPDGPGAFYPPTVLFGVSKGMPVFDEETFGPVAAVIRAQGDADAIRLANDSAFGLGASLWTRNGERAEDIAGDLDVGCVFVNEAVKSDPRLPFGGVKRSGYGRELSEYGIREFVNIKSVWMAQSGVESCEPTNSANSSAEANKKSKPLGDDSLDEEHLEEMIDETLAESFPASDPPSWTLGRERWKPSTGTESSAKTARAQTSTVKPKDKAGG